MVTGGVDRNMGATAFVKFCKIGALSATGTRPFDAGADGFVMGEGAALFVLKRLADAERDGDRIYAVLLGVGRLQRRQGQGDHRPEPGRAAARDRAGLAATLASTRSPRASSKPTAPRPASVTPPSWRASPPSSAPATIAPGSIALGSVKSNIGHLKGAAGAAGLFKLAMAAAREGAAAEPELPRPEPERRLGRFPVPGEHRTA